MSGRAEPWLLAVAVALAAVFALLSGSDTPSQLGRGSTAPPFDLERVGAPGSMTLADLKGKVVLVNFWATWCKPCEDEMPAMERLYQELRGDRFELLAVSVDRDAPAVAAFRDRLGVSFPIALDDNERVSRLYQTTGYPESLLIDAEGRLVERYVGPRDWDDRVYVERVRALLSEAATGS